MTTGRHLVHERDRRRVRRRRSPRTPTTCPSATRPAARSRSARSSTTTSATSIHGLVTAQRSTAARTARPRAAPTRGCSTGRPCSPTSPPTRRRTPRRSSARSRRSSAFGDLDEAVALAGDTDYGLSLGHPHPRRACAALELADRIPTGIVHINDQTVNDEAVIPFGGVGASGTGARFGGARPTSTPSPTPSGSPPSPSSRVPLLTQELTGRGSPATRGAGRCRGSSPCAPACARSPRWTADPCGPRSASRRRTASRCRAGRQELRHLRLQHVCRELRAVGLHPERPGELTEPSSRSLPVRRPMNAPTTLRGETSSGGIGWPTCMASTEW